MKTYQEIKKKEKQKLQQQEKKLDTVEAWTPTVCMPRHLPDHWATEQNTEDCVKNIMFKAFSCGFCRWTSFHAGPKNKLSESSA